MLLKRWDYTFRDQACFAELHDTSWQICYYSDKVTSFSFRNFLREGNGVVPPELQTEMLQAMVSQAQPMPDFSDWDRLYWLFWDSIDFSKLEEYVYEIDEYNRFVLNKEGASIYRGIWTVSSRPPQRYDFKPLHLFYFRCIGESVLPIETRTTAWAAMEACFSKNKDLLKPKRCILIDYTKIKRQEFQVHDEGSNYNSGLFLSLNKYISAGGWSGRDGGGSMETYEQFWYEYEHSPVQSDWKEKVPEILENIRQAIVHGAPELAPPA